MKIFQTINNCPGHEEKGLATMVFLILLGIMMMLAAANTAALIHLHREVKLLEQRQITRLNNSTAHPASIPSNSTHSN